MLSYEEKVKLLKTAGGRPDWLVARCAAILAFNTTIRGCELKGLRWSDVNLIDQTVTVRHSKTKAGERVIPLNSDSMPAILELYKRSQAFGGAEPNHYVFPACENSKIDPARPQASWRTAWRRITREAGLRGLRFHDVRHHAITELAESQTSDQTIMSIAGHVSPRMLAHYSHVRLQAKRRALEALSNWSTREGYGTKTVTSPPAEGMPSPQVIETYGRPVGARTPDLHRVKVAL